jgi:hypothetical protein
MTSIVIENKPSENEGLFIYFANQNVEKEKIDCCFLMATNT